MNTELELIHPPPINVLDEIESDDSNSNYTTNKVIIDQH